MGAQTSAPRSDCPCKGRLPGEHEVRGGGGEGRTGGRSSQGFRHPGPAPDLPTVFAVASYEESNHIEQVSDLLRKLDGECDLAEAMNWIRKFSDLVGGLAAFLEDVCPLWWFYYQIPIPASRVPEGVEQALWRYAAPHLLRLDIQGFRSEQQRALLRPQVLPACLRAFGGPLVRGAGLHPRAPAGPGGSKPLRPGGLPSALQVFGSDALGMERAQGHDTEQPRSGGIGKDCLDGRDGLYDGAPRLRELHCESSANPGRRAEALPALRALWGSV